MGGLRSVGNSRGYPCWQPGASEARPGAENPKILPRRKNIFVIHSNGEASGLCRVMQYNLSLASAIVDTPQKCFYGVSGDFWILGLGFQCRVAVPYDLVPTGRKKKQG